MLRRCECHDIAAGIAQETETGGLISESCGQGQATTALRFVFLKKGTNSTIYR